MQQREHRDEAVVREQRRVLLAAVVSILGDDATKNPGTSRFCCHASRRVDETRQRARGHPGVTVRSEAMCGRFVAATPPDQLARYFGAGSGRDAAARELQRRADDRHLRGRRRPERPRARGLPLGSRAGLGQGHQDRQPDDQRTGRDRRDLERVQARAEEEALHHPRRRLLRVEGDAGGEAQAALLHPPARRRAARVRGAVGDVARRRIARPSRRSTRPRSSRRRRTRRCRRSTTACR